MVRRLNDQVIVLEAIAEVRKSLNKDMNWIEQGEVMVRLATLYSLLNVDKLRDAAVQADQREYHEDERKVA